MTQEMLDKQIKERRLHNIAYAFHLLETPITMPEHKLGDKPSEKQIVEAWEKIINEWYAPVYKVYTDEFYITRMLMDIALSRKWIK